MNRLNVAILLSGLVFAAACGKKDSAGGKAGATAPAVDIAALANAAVPAAAKATLVFENIVVKDDGETMRFARPQGWTVANQAFAGKFKPPATADLGFMTSFSVGTGCDGACEPKDWKAVIDKQMMQFIADGPNSHDEALPNGGRIRWDNDGKAAHVLAAWFKTGDRHYRSCTVWLDSPALATSVDAFIAASKAVRFE